jgi:2-hydroxychromene-2-carboxylate isomerase
VPSAPTIDFWFEFASTYSYPAALRVEQLAAERGVAISWRSFLLGPIFAAQGWNDSPFKVYPVKGRYMWRDLARICAAHDIPLRRPSQFPRGSLLAARVVARFAGEPWIPAFVRAVYRANFAEDLDISTPDVVGRCLVAAGREPGDILEQAQSPDAKARLRANTDEAIGLDIFGAPSFVVRGELFWGHDRLEDALRWAVERAA